MPAATPPPSAKGPRQRIEFIDPSTLMRIKDLQMRAQVVVQGFYSGIHRSPYHGFSVEFSEYRQYSSGDDVRYVDWRLFARSDRYYVKRFEDETNLLCYLLVDTSRSMAFSAGSYSKCDYARTLAATLAYFLHLQRDCVGLITFDEQITNYLPPRHRPGHLRHLMTALQQDPAGTSTDLTRPLEQIARTVRKRGLVVLISDLLAPHESLATQLGYLRSRGHDVVVLRVLDPTEISFSFDNPSLFVDLESGHKLFVDPAFAKQEYLERMQAHHHQIERTCRDLGIDYETYPTDRPLELALGDLLRTRSHRGIRRMRRERAPRSSP
jgi:uncharacterized protein (DUF58 family)